MNPLQAAFTAGNPHLELVGPEDGEQHRGQLRIAYRLAAGYTGRLLHVGNVGWHVWDGTRWAIDERGDASKAVFATLQTALIEAVDLPGKDRDALHGDVRRCETASGVDGVLRLAAALEPFAAVVTDLDADPYLLNCASVTLDLRTGRTRPHEPADRITKVCGAGYDPQASAEAWGAFLAEALPDPDVRAFLQRLVGLALVGKVVEHVLPILTGTGGNGKGVAYGAWLYALGDYAAAAEPDLFMAREGAHPTGQMDLRGRRLVVVSESDKSRQMAEATMKRLTGGDRIKARFMGQDFVEFEPSHTAFLVTNHLPKVSGDDDAVWRRVRVVPFQVVVPEEQRDGQLGERLELEADAVLAWAVTGYGDYVRRGHRLDEPDSVRVATAAYRVESDAVTRFLTECCYLNPHVRATTAELFARWQSWAALDGAEAMSQKALGQALDRHGLVAQPPVHGKRWRRGIELLPPEQDTAEHGWNR